MLRGGTMTRILVIDDDPSVCDTLSRVLSSCGYAVNVATSGRAGLDAAAREPFAAALIDLCMPDVSGFDAIRALRARAPHLRLIAMSGLMSDCEGETPDFLGMAANLQGIPRLGKPFRREELLGLVERCCTA
jgi:CheY-like chemotaxis protein